MHALLATALMGSLNGHAAAPQSGAEVTVHFTVRAADGKLLVPSTRTPVVVWLSPLGQDGAGDPSAGPANNRTFEMVQQDKTFRPHLLVVPTGSLVAFPNRDPFFHNVFSLFNGRRFDLGLYATGASHSVPFNREGVSYIFCNIHPDMGAVIVSVATPYFGTATQATLQLRQVPPGAYTLKVWAEGATEASLQSASRRVEVGERNTDVGLVGVVLRLPQAHADKYGKPYSQHPEDPPY